MPFDAYDTAYELSLWRGLPLRHFTAKASELREKLPDFELRPFGEPPNDNPRMHCIVRMPTSYDRYERPVSAVSKRYDLLQHQVVASWLAANLDEAGLADLKAKVVMTEYGERLRITVPLEDREFDFGDDLFKPDRYRPELEILNSVDRGLAFTVVLRWRRLICSNGLFTVEEDRIRSVHRVDLSRTHLVREFIAERLGATPDVAAELRKWKKIPVEKEKVQEWCEGWLREKSGWTVENCARVWAILETGFDGTVIRPGGTQKRTALSEHRVGQHRKVPGVNFPVQTAYDVAQILMWITSHQKTVEMELEGTEEVPKLMRALLRK